MSLADLARPVICTSASNIHPIPSAFHAQTRLPPPQTNHERMCLPAGVSLLADMGPRAFVPSFYCPWPLFTQQDLAEKSPTRVYIDDKGVFKGQSQKKEEAEIKTVIELMGNAGMTIRLHT